MAAVPRELATSRDLWRDTTRLLRFRAQCRMCLRYWNDPPLLTCYSCELKRRYPICATCLARFFGAKRGFLCPPCSKDELHDFQRGFHPEGLAAVCEREQQPAAEGQGAAICPVCSEAATRLYAATKRTLNILKNATFRKPEEIMKNFKEPVTLDPDTVFYRLTLFENGKRVMYTNGKGPRLPDNPKRFTQRNNVLGKEGFSSGRHYWEVQLLDEEGGWSIGVARESISRKGPCDEEPEAGVWAVGFNGDYLARTSLCAPICVPLREWPKKLGVYMDYDEGWLSVYNADTLEHFYTFTCVDFTGWGRVFPYFESIGELRLV